MHLLIAAAGSGRRMGADCNKLLLPLLGRPLLAWTFEAINSSSAISWVGIIGQSIDQQMIMEIAQTELNKPFYWIQGGNTRQESVQRGLSALPPKTEYVLIHDGARCLVQPSLINKCAKNMSQGMGLIAAVPVTDTIKRVDKKGFVLDTPEREWLWAAQTPQCFAVDDLIKGHHEAIKKGWFVTDDASLYEQLQWPVKVLKADPSNIKVTTPFDLKIAEAVLTMRKSG